MLIAAVNGRREGVQSGDQVVVDHQDPHWRLARLYQAMGKQEEAKAEFEKTKTLHEAVQESIFSKLKAAQDRGTPAAPQSSPPTEK